MLDAFMRTLLKTRILVETYDTRHENVHARVHVRIQIACHDAGLSFGHSTLVEPTRFVDGLEQPRS